MEPLKFETLPTWLSSLPIPPLGWTSPMVYLQERKKLNSIGCCAQLRIGMKC